MKGGLTMISAFLVTLGIILAIVFVVGLAIYGVVKLVLAVIGGTIGGVMNGMNKVRRK